MQKKYISWEQILEALKPIDIPNNKIYGVPKGGMIVAGYLKQAENTPFIEEADVILDDIIDSGRTKRMYENKYPDKEFIALIIKDSDEWIVFPWEVEHPSGEETIEQNITRQLEYIGEDPNREGLKETPNRITKAWNELFAGYQKSPEDVLTTFDTDGYDQMVLSRNIEMYSMCEHHMLPFFGRAHVAYIPDERVIGISKLARLVDIYARRLQIQERLGEQVTSALMEHLKPKGAACIIEAQHLCMMMRGVSKQNSIMVTSSLKGVFLDQSGQGYAARNELMRLIG